MKKIIVVVVLFISTIAYAQQVYDSTKWKIGLGPDFAQLWANDSMKLNIYAQSKVDNSSVVGFGWSLASQITPKAPLITVNGIPNGNYAVGYIFIRDGYHITYIAPYGEKPEKNPVEITATYEYLDYGGKLNVLKITSHIEILGGWEFMLDPDSAWLRVKDTLPLSLAWVYTDKNNYWNGTNPGNGWFLFDQITPSAPKWTVNGIPEGNALVGQIIRNGPRLITFKAPAQLPVKNPVEVIATYDSIWKNEKYVPQKFTTHIWIVDSVDNSSEDHREKTDTIHVKNKVLKETYEINMVGSLKGGSNASWGGVVTYNDQGSFRVIVEGEKAVVTDIQNNLEVFTSNCSKIITNPTTCTGIFHVVGAKSILVTPAKPPAQPYPIVEIWFVPHPTELTQYKFTCPPPPSARGSSIGQLDMSRMAMMAIARMPALPPYLKFIAKDGEQILIEKGTPGSELYYKFSLRKIKSE